MMNLKNTIMEKNDARHWFMKGVNCVKKYGSMEPREMIDLFDSEWNDEEVILNKIVDNKEDLFKQLDYGNLSEESIKELSSVIMNFKNKQ